jgi:cytochrome bd-type quinol oxidase subunit 2
MENTGISKYTISFGLSLALASVVNGLLVVAKEKSPAVLAGMQKLTGNQWVSHGVIILVLFALFGWLFARANGGQGIKMTANHLIRAVVAGVAAGGLIILGFYLIGD